ncbi:hypothetical protein V8E51_008727 [Hyaloscypha variabilis]
MTVMTGDFATFDASTFQSSLNSFISEDDVIFSSDLLYLTYPTLIAKEQYTLFGAPFIADYEAAHDGRHPFLDPNPAVRWAFAQTNETIFKDWWNSEVIKADQDTCSDSLLLYPGTLATSIYRYVYLNPPVIPTGWGIYNVAIFAGVPDMVFPIGEGSYNSTITLHEEMLPIAVGIIAAPGCDAIIFDLAVHLEKAGIVNIPKTGIRVTEHSG